MFEIKRSFAQISDEPNKIELDFYNGRYFVINMNMLQITGLWPYQKKIQKLIIRVLFTIAIIVPAIPHVVSAIVHRDNVELLIQGTGTVFYFISIGFKYFSMLMTEEKLKFLYKNMAHNWSILENKTEKDILAKSSETGRLLTIGYFTYMVGAVNCFVSLPLAPGMINKIYPLFNDSDKLMVLNGEYLVDKDEYYYQIYVFEAAVSLMTVPMFSTIDSTYAVCVHQCVGLLRVVRLRLEVATKINLRLHPINCRNDDAVRNGIVKTAELHEKVLNFCRILESSYSTSFLFVMGTSTMTLVTTTVGILFNLHRPLFLLRFLFLLNGFAIHLFYLSYPGQKTIDSSEAVFYAAYNNEWYESSIECQKLLHFIMRRSLRPFELTAGGFYVMSFENFEMLMKTALSYITVLASFR